MLKRTSEAQETSSSQDGQSGVEVRSPDSNLVLRSWLQLARRRGAMVIGIALVFAIAAMIYAMQLTPFYTAKATLLLVPARDPAAGQQAILTGEWLDPAEIEGQVELIKTADMAERVVSRLKLTKLESWFAASPNVVREAIGSIFGSSKPPQPSLEDDVSGQAIRRLQNSLSARRRMQSYVIEINYTDRNPGLAAQIVNGYADEYLVDQLETKFDSTRRANEWLNERLNDLRAKVEQSERAVDLFKKENNIVNTTAGTLTDQQVAKLNEQLILARAETAQAAVALEQLRSVVERGGEASSFADELQSQQIAALNSKASEVRRELAELSSKYGSRHPSVQTARAQLSDIQHQISNQTKLIVASAENRHRVAQSREASIEASLQEMTGTVSKLSESEIRLRELEREATANRTLYESFLSRFKETSQVATRQVAESRILERATAPQTPSGPNKKRIAVMGLFIGLMIGGGLAFVVEALDSGYRTADQVEKFLGVPLLASVPRADDEIPKTFLEKLNPLRSITSQLSSKARGANKSDRKKRAAMVRLVVDKPLSPYAEAIRTLRMGIRFANIDEQPRTILVSSALPHEGKSTIAASLAYYAAANGERVLLIDMDLRHPALTQAMAPQAKAGLIEVVLQEASLETLLLRDGQTGLYFLPAPNRAKLTQTAEILGSDRIRDLLRGLVDQFDTVVIDTSPLLPVTDGRALVQAVDAMLMVVHWEQTNRDAVMSALRMSPGAKEKLAGVIFNDVVANRARHYDYYKSGYYMKKYPYYYKS
jgi:polysaccharide biosynthesis transport protein